MVWRLGVAVGIGCGGGGNPLVGELAGDGVEAPPGYEHFEDPAHHGGGGRVGFEAVLVLAGGGFGRGRMRSGVDQPVPIGWASPQEASFDGGLGGHGGPDPSLDAVAFPFAHSPIEAHHDLMGIRARVDRASYLRYPQLDRVVDEDREGQPELVGVEGSLRFADHDCLKTPVRVGEVGEEAGGLGAPGPGEGAGLADVEVLGDDLPAGRVDELAGPGELPVAGRGGVLLVFGGDPPVEREPHHG